MDPSLIRRSAILFIVSAPSGAGKTTISRRALGEIDGLELSVSCTTRAPRPKEVPGRDYHFVSAAEFDRMRSAGEFAEWAQVHDFFYGTPRAPLVRALEQGRDVLLDIDVQGARQLKAQYPRAVAVFVLPPSERELERRLRSRGTDAEEIIRRRLTRARAEMDEVGGYDYYVINREVAESVRLLGAIVQAERARVDRILK